MGDKNTGFFDTYESGGYLLNNFDAERLLDENGRRFYQIKEQERIVALKNLFGDFSQMEQDIFLLLILIGILLERLKN